MGVFGWEEYLCNLLIPLGKGIGVTHIVPSLNIDPLCILSRTRIEYRKESYLD
jgi:hypothetical protein